MDPKRALYRDEPPAWYAKQTFRLLLDQLRRLQPDERGRLQGAMTEELLTRTLDVETTHGPIAFMLPSALVAGRALALLRKQPETIAWIDRFEPQSVFWDIGANIGTFTLYAAARRDVTICAFEPAAVNYFTLTASCEANGFEDRVQCLLAGLSDRPGIARLGVSQFAPGESFSFGETRGRSETSHQATLIACVDQLVEDYGLPCPNYIKLDVPSMTRQIVAGAARTLKRPELRGVHLGTKLKAKPGSVFSMLTAAGFTPAASTGDQPDADITFVRA